MHSHRYQAYVDLDRKAATSVRKSTAAPSGDWLRTDFTTRRHCGWVDHPPNACVWWTVFSHRARFVKKMNNGKITLAGQVVSAGDRLLVRAFTDSVRGVRGVRASGR